MSASDPSEIVFINVFSVAPEHQDRLIGLLTSATEGFVNRAGVSRGDAAPRPGGDQGDHVLAMSEP